MYSRVWAPLPPRRVTKGSTRTGAVHETMEDRRSRRSPLCALMKVQVGDFSQSHDFPGRSKKGAFRNLAATPKGRTDSSDRPSSAAR